MEINEQKRQKFMENASKRVNNVMHNIQILEPMARSNTYDFTKNDVEEMFAAMQETLDNVKQEFYKKFELKAKSERKAFSFGQKNIVDANSGIVDDASKIINDEVTNTADEDNGKFVEQIANEVGNIESNIIDNVDK